MGGTRGSSSPPPARYGTGIGLRGAIDSNRSWVYCPEEPAPFFRATYFTNYSPHNAPDEDHSSLMCDCSYSKNLPRSRETIAEETVAGLIACGILAEEDRERIVSAGLRSVPGPGERDPAVGENLPRMHDLFHASGLAEVDHEERVVRLQTLRRPHLDAEEVLGRQALSRVATVVTPDTILRWHSA